MIRINSLNTDPIHEILYEFPAQGGGVAVGRFEVFQAFTDNLPLPLGRMPILTK